jgi:hypothetical protein
VLSFNIQAIVVVSAISFFIRLEDHHEVMLRGNLLVNDEGLHRFARNIFGIIFRRSAQELACVFTLVAGCILHEALVAMLAIVMSLV